jgi:hypothetical protein
MNTLVVRDPYTQRFPFVPLDSSWPGPKVVPASDEASELVTSWQGSREVAAADWVAAAELAPASGELGDEACVAAGLAGCDDAVVAGELHAASSSPEATMVRVAAVGRMGVSPAVWVLRRGSMTERIERERACPPHP